MIREYNRDFVWDNIDFITEMETVSMESLCKVYDELFDSIFPLFRTPPCITCYKGKNYKTAAVQDALIQWQLMADENLMKLTGVDTIAEKINEYINDEVDEDLITDDTANRVSNTIKEIQKRYGFNRIHFRKIGRNYKINKYIFYQLRAYFKVGYEINRKKFSLPLYSDRSNLDIFNKGLAELLRLKSISNLDHYIYYNLFLAQSPLDLALTFPEYFDSDKYNDNSGKYMIAFMSILDSPLIENREELIKTFYSMDNKITECENELEKIESQIDKITIEICKLLAQKTEGDEEKDVDITPEIKKLLFLEYKQIMLKDKICSNNENLKKWNKDMVTYNLIVYPLIVEGLLMILRDSNVRIVDDVYKELSKSMDSKMKNLDELSRKLRIYFSKKSKISISNYEYKIIELIKNYDRLKNIEHDFNKVASLKLEYFIKNNYDPEIDEFVLDEVHKARNDALLYF
jgi:hypothetical protein